MILHVAPVAPSPRQRAVGRGEQCSGLGPAEPHSVCVSGEDCGAGGGPGPGSAGGEGRGSRSWQTAATRETPLLEEALLPGPLTLTRLYQSQVPLQSVLPIETLCNNIDPPSGARGGRVCTLQKCVLPAHPRTRPGRTPLGSPARHHDRPGHCAPPAGALRAAALQADRGLPEGQPPMFTRSPGTGVFHTAAGKMITTLHIWASCCFATNDF